MRKTILLLFTLSLATLSFAFDCKDVDPKPYCEGLTGCFWKENKCIGKFIPEDSAIYVYPGTKDSKIEQKGTSQNPYASLLMALEQGESGGEQVVIGINLPGQVFSINDQYVQLPVNLTIKALSNSTFMEIDQSNFKGSGVIVSHQSSLTMMGIKLYVSKNYDDIGVIDTYKSQFYLIDSVVTQKKSIIPSPFLIAKASNITYQNTSIQDGCLITRINLNNFDNYKMKLNLNQFVAQDIQQNCSFLFDLIRVDLVIKDSIFENIAFKEFDNPNRYQTIILAKELKLLMKNTSLTDMKTTFIQSSQIRESIIEDCEFKHLQVSSILRMIGQYEPRNFINHTESIFQFINNRVEDVNISQNLMYFSSMAAKIEGSSFYSIYPLLVDPDAIDQDENITTIAQANSQSNLLFESNKLWNIGYDALRIHDSLVQVLNSIFIADQKKSKQARLSWIKIIQDTEYFLIDQISLPYGSIIQNNSFYGGKQAIKGGQLYVYSIWPTNLQVIDNFFMNGNFDLGGAINLELGQETPFFKLIIKNCILQQQLSGLNGGAISLLSKSNSVSEIQEGNIEIQSNIFSQNRASIGGGIFLSGIPATISQNTFNLNEAWFGGAVALAYGNRTQVKPDNLFRFNYGWSGGGSFYNPTETEIPKEYTLQKDSNFPQAELKEGPRSFRYTYHKLLLPEVFYKNHEPKYFVEQTNLTQKFAVYTDENISNLQIGVIPGHNLPMIFQIEVLNQFNEVLNDYDLLSLIDFGLLNDNFQKLYEQDRKSSLAFINGSFYLFDQFTISAQFHENNEVILTTKEDSPGLLQATRNLLIVRIFIKIGECSRGDIYDSQLEICTPCPNSTFSQANPLSPTATCQQCKPSLQCYGSNLSLPAAGYYKYNENQSYAIKCLNPSACLGGFHANKIDFNGFCEDPFQGNMCNQCKKGYTKSTIQESCIPCQGSISYYLSMILSLILIFAIVLYSIQYKQRQAQEIKQLINSNNENDHRIAQRKLDKSAILKIIVSFKQVYTLIGALNFELLRYLKQFFGFTTQLIPLIINGFSLNCIFSNKDFDPRRIFYYNYILQVAQPFLLWIIFLGFVLIKKLIFSSTQVRQNMKEGFIIILYLAQPSILIQSLSLFNCKELDEGDSFLVSDFNIRCYDDDFYAWSYGLGIPMLIIWGIILPLLLFKKLKNIYNNSNADQKATEICQYSFVVGGLKPEYYYWEMIGYIKKMLIIVIVIALTKAGIFGQVISVLFVLYVNFKIQTTLYPYQNTKVNQLEARSLELLILLTFTGSYTHSLQGGPQSDFQTLWVFVMSIGTMVLALVFYLQAVVLLWKNTIFSFEDPKKINWSQEMETMDNDRFTRESKLD